MPRATFAGGPRLVLILGGLSAFGPLSMDMYLPGLPALTRELGATATTGQLTLTGCMLGIAAGQLFIGPLSDSLGRRRPLLTGLVGYVAASLACAFAPSITALIVLRFIQGTLGGAGVVIARAVVRDLFSGSAAARVYALLMAVMGVAPVFAPLVGGQALAVTSWRGIFVILAAIGVPLLIGTLLWLPETLPPERRHGGGLGVTGRTFGRLVRDRSFMPAATSFALAAAVLFAYIAGSSFVLEDVYGVSPQSFSLVFAVNSAGLVGMSQLGGRLVSRVGAGTLLRIALVGVAAGSTATLIVTLAHGGLAPLLVSLFVITSFNGMVFPNATAVALAEQEGALGSASALLGMSQFASGAIVAPLVGLSGSHDALPMGVLIGVCGVSALAVNLIFSTAAAVRDAAPAA
ncbi:MAG: multidrug effflux MFS transporter [Solirubrobacterales bacterium]|nr:multidrug effflux MFS transporter [Solirubrobacterales bacterium]MBV9943955.1 multidrug effflux MFS transporter [Solirubrobacterales bacterium]